MSWKLKVKILEKQGVDKETAMMQILDEYQNKIKSMDLLLVECMNYLNTEDFKRIFGEKEKDSKKSNMDL